MSTPSLKNVDNSVDYETPQLMQQEAQEDKEKEEVMKSLKEAEKELHITMSNAVVSDAKKTKWARFDRYWNI